MSKLQKTSDRNTSEFSLLWTFTSKQMPRTNTSPLCKELQSPKQRGSIRFLYSNNADSPGETEVSQDIVWDSTSPTHSNTGLLHRSTRNVPISDIVNRIAPKDVKPKGADSPWLQWIGDSAIPCTPEVPRPRLRKRSTRQSSVDDLVKLARQFDENMQQDKASSDHLNTFNTNLNECSETSETKLTRLPLPGNVKDRKFPSSSDRIEAELQELFDSSTQRISGRLSECSAPLSTSQEIKDQAVTSSRAQTQQSKSGSAVHPAAEKTSNEKSCVVDFDDDWEDDDSFVLAMSQNPNEQHISNPKSDSHPNTKTNTTKFNPSCKPNAKTISLNQPSSMHIKPRCSALQELCPKPKTTNRSTFKLEPNPHFQDKMANPVTVEPKSLVFDQKASTSNTSSAPQPDGPHTDQSGAHLKAGKEIPDSLWDDGEDDALFYQVCDNLERISNSQPQQASSRTCQDKQDAAIDRQRKTTEPQPVTAASSTNVSACRQSPHAFVRSNSLPGMTCETVNYQGWNVPMKGANNKSGMSQSFPGSNKSLGTFSQHPDSPGNFQPVTGKTATNFKSNQTAFKRNMSDSAAISNSKVFVTSQTRVKCSAAEIEKKKQDALARRRLRMQNASNHKDTPH